MDDYTDPRPVYHGWTLSVWRSGDLFYGGHHQNSV